jgi:hypothetical protein
MQPLLMYRFRSHVPLHLWTSWNRCPWTLCNCRPWNYYPSIPTKRLPKSILKFAKPFDIPSSSLLLPTFASFASDATCTDIVVASSSAEDHLVMRQPSPESSFGSFGMVVIDRSQQLSKMSKEGDGIAKISHCCGLPEALTEFATAVRVGLYIVFLGAKVVNRGASSTICAPRGISIVIHPWVRVRPWLP